MGLGRSHVAWPVWYHARQRGPVSTLEKMVFDSGSTLRKFMEPQLNSCEEKENGYKKTEWQGL